jgi:uncharacterized protein YaaQ
VVTLKLLIAIVHDEDAGKIIDEFTDNSLRITKLCSTGGFIKGGNTTLLCGLEDNQVGKAIIIIERNTQSRENVAKNPSGKISSSRATIFVTNIERYAKF